MSEMEIFYRDPKELIYAEYNPRRLTDEQHKDLSDSIRRFGFAEPVVVNRHKERDNILVGGHQRVRVAIDLGIERIPTVEVYLDQQKERELNVRLNKNTGEWDFEALANFFDVEELTNWGFNEIDLGMSFFEEPEGGTSSDEGNGKDLSDSLTTEYKIEIELENEDQQESLFNRLVDEGYKCRILTL